MPETFNEIKNLADEDLEKLITIAMGQTDLARQALERDPGTVENPSPSVIKFQEALGQEATLETEAARRLLTQARKAFVSGQTVNALGYLGRGYLLRNLPDSERAKLEWYKEDVETHEDLANETDPQKLINYAKFALDENNGIKEPEIRARIALGRALLADPQGVHAIRVSEILARTVSEVPK